MPDEPARVSVPILKVIELSGQPSDQIEFQLDPGACRITKLPDRGAEEFFTRRNDAPEPWVDYEGKAETYYRMRFKLERQKVIACDKRLHAVFGRAA